MERMLYDGMNDKEKIEYLEKRIAYIIKSNSELQTQNSELKIQRDYYKREYSLQNKTLDEVIKLLCKRGE